MSSVPFVIEAPEGRADLILTCEHAGNLWPRGIESAGITPEDFQAHWGWDIGTAELTRGLSARLDAPAILGVYSRLLVDLNRSEKAKDLIKVYEPDGARHFPCNDALSPQARAARLADFYAPYHDALSGMIDRSFAQRGTPPFLFSIHSYTPVYCGIPRAWDVGVLWSDHPRDAVFAQSLIGFFTRKGYLAGDNEPYSLPAMGTDFLPRHSADRDVPFVIFEVRNDLVQTAAQIATMTDHLVSFFAEFCGMEENPERPVCHV